MSHEEMWSLFHKVWTRDVGTPGYQKDQWIELEKMILSQISAAAQASREAFEEAAAFVQEILDADQGTALAAALRAKAKEST